MTALSKAGGRAAAVVVGGIAGALIIFGLDGLTGGSEPDTGSPSRTEATTGSDGGIPTTGNEGAQPGDKEAPGGSTRLAPGVFLAWSPGDLPAGTEATLESLPEVKDATTVLAGLDWIADSRTASGEVVDKPPRGFGIPFEIAAIEPREYARFVPRADREAVRDLDDGNMLLAETSAELRKQPETGSLKLDLGQRTLTTSGVVTDLATNGYEALMAAPAPAEWRLVDRFVLVHLRNPNDEDVVEKAIKELLPPGQPLRTRSEGENPFLRYGDAVLPQMLVKDVFGEFAGRPLPSGAIEIEKGWAERNILTAQVPILGEIRCHRVLFPQLREAFRDIDRQGLSHAIHPAQYSGCYVPRFVNSNPGGRLSHHSWGIAIDVNANDNRFGIKPTMDERVVDIFEDRWGFTWGGHWLIPDGMHFEWLKFP